jgi:DMSO reductase family type II enzyme heme b subunit
MLLDPGAAEWSAIPAEVVGLSGTPLATQPSGYVRSRFEPQNVGRVKAVEVRSAHDGARIYFRLTWKDDCRNVAVTENNDFPDACGLLLPLNGGDPPLQEMGSPQAPVNAWYWRADDPERARNLVAEGLGTTRLTESQPIAAHSTYADSSWAVVLTRELALANQKEETAPLGTGAKTRIGFAVWEGGNGERAGVKAFSREWRELSID